MTETCENKMETPHWLNLLHNASGDLTDEAYALSQISRTLRRVGSIEIANDLQEIAWGLDKTAKDIQEATNLKTTQDVKDAMGMSAAMFTAVLHSVDKNQKAKPKVKQYEKEGYQ